MRVRGAKELYRPVRVSRDQLTIDFEKAAMDERIRENRPLSDLFEDYDR